MIFSENLNRGVEQSTPMSKKIGRPKGCVPWNKGLHSGKNSEATKKGWIARRLNGNDHKGGWKNPSARMNGFKKSECSGSNNNFYGKHHLCETKKTIGLKNSHPLSVEHRLAIGRSICGEQNGMFGRTHTHKTRLKLSKLAAERMARNKNTFKPSKIETQILDELECALGITIERQFIIHDDYWGSKVYDGRWRQMLIEVDGMFYHRLARQVTNDLIKSHLARKNGFRLHRINIRG